MGRKYEFRLIGVNSCEKISFESEDGSLELVVEEVFSKLKCVEGGNVSGLYQVTEDTFLLMEKLEVDYDVLTKKRIRRLTRFFSRKKINVGDFFIKQMTYTPMPDQVRNLNKMYCIKNGLDYHGEDVKFCQTWLWAYLKFDTYSYGWCDDDVYVGECSVGERVCRFCSNTSDDKFKKKAHAISESLGNKHLFSNEECDDCNGRFAKIEDHFLRLMDVRRTMFKISGKSSVVHCVAGENFVIRPNELNEPIIYLKKESLPTNIDETMSFSYKLIHKWFVTNENIYKALVKYVVGLLPNKEVCHFYNTIKWLNGDMISDELPPMLFGMHERRIEHPIIDIYINKKKHRNTPYCTAVFYSCNIAYMFVIPFCCIDKGRYKTLESLIQHYDLMQRRNYLVKKWSLQSTYEFWNCQAWCWWRMEPSKYEIRPANDAVFTLHEMEGKRKGGNYEFPNIETLGLEVMEVKKEYFKLHIDRVVAEEELVDSSLDLLENQITIIDKFHASLKFGVKVSDTDNRIPFFEFGFIVKFKSLNPIGDYIVADSEDEYIIDYHLIDLIHDLGLNVGEKKIESLRECTCFENCKVTRILEDETRRFLHVVDIDMPYKRMNKKV